MNKQIEQYRDYLIEDVFSQIAERITSRAMFGGVSLYLDGRIFALIVSSGEAYLKVGDNNRADFEVKGSKPFMYDGHKNKKPAAMPYWLMPEELTEDKNLASDWAETAAENS